MRIKHQIIILLLSVLPFIGEAQTWNSIGSGLSGISTPSCISSSDKLYFGAGYSNATFAGLSVRGVCCFNGLYFDTLNQGIYGSPNAVIWYNNKLVAAGNAYCAGIPPNCIPNTVNIAAWDSTNGWQSITPVGGGADYSIKCLEVFNNELYAGGQFVTIDNISVSRIAKWNGSQWTNMATGVHGGNGVVNCMTVYHNALYVAGDFTNVGSTNLTSYYIAKWDGSSWDSVPTGPNWYITDMVVDSVNDLLYVSGGFTNVDGNTCYGVAVWNDSIWQPVGSGLDTLWGTQCLAMYNGELYAGGGNVTITTQGDTIKNIYKFNGTKWVSVDGGANNSVMNLAVFNGNLYVGGAFSQVGYGITANKIACYGTTCPTSVGVEEKTPAVPFTMFPNPNRDILRIESNEPNPLRFRLFDLNGKLIEERYFSEKMEYDTKPLSKGTYIVQVSLEDGKRLHSEKLIISE